MNYSLLGDTGISVSRLCFGALVIGPLQAGMTPDDGAGIIFEAFCYGVNFIDTAEIYGTYPHVRTAVKLLKEFEDKNRSAECFSLCGGKQLVIASKSYAYNEAGARLSLEKALKEMGLETIDMFLMHEQESSYTLKGHREAFEFYLKAKNDGLIKAVGVSTHNVEVVEICAEMPEIDVIHPIINRSGIGMGGKPEAMLTAVAKAYGNGKGIYGMKALGGGNLVRNAKENLEFVFGLPFVHSIAVGMKTINEVRMNALIASGHKLPLSIEEAVRSEPKKLHIEYWCTGCGKCTTRCKQGALYLQDGRAVCIGEKCLLCGYCGTSCEAFAIKVI
ncbi:MAG: aldo/keto reductase [Clostridiales bacterium]|nr:aldo/keto reductase [Clostridiales bacterium]